MLEDRAGVDEGVELAVLAAGVDANGEVGQQRLVEGAADERRIELARIDADEHRLEARLNELEGEFAGVPLPERDTALRPAPLRRSSR